MTCYSKFLCKHEVVIVTSTEKKKGCHTTTVFHKHQNTNTISPTNHKQPGGFYMLIGLDLTCLHLIRLYISAPSQECRLHNAELPFTHPKRPGVLRCYCKSSSAYLSFFSLRMSKKVMRLISRWCELS